MKFLQFITSDPAKLSWMRFLNKQAVPNEPDELLLPGDALRRKWRRKFALALGPATTGAPTQEPVPSRANPAPDSPGNVAH